MPEAEHSDMGPSALSRILACPGSFALSQRPEVKALGRRRSVHAAKGTVAHGVAEGLLSGGGVQQGPVQRDGFDIDVDDAMVEAVQIYTELCEGFIALSDWHVVEKRVSLDNYWLPGKPPVPIFGTTDFAGYWAAQKLLRIIDYKHGAGVYVSAERNPQGLAYAAGSVLLCPGPVRTVEITIVQPNAPGRQKVRTEILTHIELADWVAGTLIPGVARTQTEPDTYVTGPQCRFCPGAALCPKIAEAASEEAAQQFADNYNTGLSGEDFAAWLARAEDAETWVKAVRKLAEDFMHDQGEVPGWGLVPTRPVRAWVNPAQTLEALESMGHPWANIVDSKLKSPAQLQKQLPADVWAQVSNQVQSVSSGTKLSRTGE